MQCVADAKLTISFPIHAASLRAAPALVLELLLAALLLVQGGRLLWLVLQPFEAPVAMPAGPAVAAAATPDSYGDLFNRDPSAAVAAGGEVDGYRLFGVRLDGPRSAAFLGRDGHQRAYVIGDELAPGVVLAEVRGDHVLLRANGREQRLDLPGDRP